MKKRIHLYVSRKNVLTWLMAACMVSSAVARIWIIGVKGIDGPVNVWSQILLPVAACLLYAAIALLDGEERLYKTSIAVWMVGLYSAIWISNNIPGRMMTWLFWVSIAAFVLLYTELISGFRRHSVCLLFPLEAATLGVTLYFYRAALMKRDLATILHLLPDVLMLTGAILMIFAIRIHPLGAYHPTWGDRTDGRRLRSIAPIDQISPYIMVNRNGASNLFSDSVEVTMIDRYIRQKRREGLTGFGFLHVMLACYCRCVAKYPAINRFMSGQKVYSRGEDIQFCMTIKKEMTASAPDTVIKVHLSPWDTAADVYRKVNAEIEKGKAEEDDTFDNVAYLFTLIPGVFLKFTVWLLKALDYFGLVPKFLLEVSPFHGSVFFTSMGSLGIPPVFHHLYDFGNLPVFCSFGCKRKALETLEDGTVVQRKYIDFRFTVDERIVDGFCYASFFKYFRRLIQHPEVLDTAPTEVNADID